MPNVGGKKYDYDADGIVSKARAAAIQVVQNPEGHSKKEVADAKAVIAKYAKEQKAKQKKPLPKATLPAHSLCTAAWLIRRSTAIQTAVVLLTILHQLRKTW